MKHKKTDARGLTKYYTSIYNTQHKKINAQIYIPFKLYKEEKKIIQEYRTAKK